MNFFTLTFPKVMNENYFLLAALRRKSDSPKEPDPCGSDSEVTVPRVLASLSSRLLHQACEGIDPGWFWLKVLREQKTRFEGQTLIFSP